VANTLWAYATMGRRPGERALGALEARVEEVARESSSQELSIILWAYATMGRIPGEWALGAMQARAIDIGAEQFSTQDRSMLDLYPPVCTPDGTSQRQCKGFGSASCREAFAAGGTSTSESQKQVRHPTPCTPHSYPGGGRAREREIGRETERQRDNEKERGREKDRECD
jgi:hypothetical protein